MPRELLWDCSNDYCTETAYARGTTTASDPMGVCAGLVTEWCKNILKSVRPELSKPFLLQAMLYQRFFDWSEKAVDTSAAIDKAFALAGLRRGYSTVFSSAGIAAQGIWRTDAVCWLRFSNHAIAAAKQSQRVLFFDPNFGCYEVPNELRLQQLLEQGQNAVKAQKTVEIYLASL
jgi:hypothetical protein